MRKVIAATEMARIEKSAYAQGASDAAYMEAAGRGIGRLIQHFIAEWGREWTVGLLCGKGNNGGDAYVAGIELRKRGFLVKAYQLFPVDHCSPLCQANCRAFREMGGEIIEATGASDLPHFECGALIDGIFGTGFRGEITGWIAEVIERANTCGIPILSVDIPSGVNGDTGEVARSAIMAACTIYLQLPKTGFFLGAGWNHVGTLRGVSFGLADREIDQAKTELWMMTRESARLLLPPIVRNRHKYQAGYVVGLAGSMQMPGAAVLSGWAALRSGAGIIRMLYPAHTPRPSFPPEVLASPVDTAEEASEIMNQAGACFVGPGLGTSPEARRMVEEVLKNLRIPCVIDADGLNLLAGSSGWALPRQTILTPHVGEMRRLLGLQKEEQPSGMDWISICQLYACNRHVTLIVKGSPTFIFDPSVGRAPIVIARGDPGMATAGCGDVLTGILAALLAQGRSPMEAAQLGTYLHAVAGECAARSQTSFSLTASDVTGHLGEAFRVLGATNAQSDSDQ